MVRWLVLIGGFLLGGCVTSTDYEARESPELTREDEERAPLISRHVAYGMTREFFQTAPRCAAVLPPVDRDGRPLKGKPADVIGEAVARHIGLRLDMVVPPFEVAAEQRARALEAHDYQRLGRSLRCDTVLEVRTPGVEETYALIFAYAKLPLELRMKRARDGALLWWGRHNAERSDGGMPIGILSAPIDLLLASAFAGDGDDRLRSMADDAARRTLDRMPRLRSGFAGGRKIGRGISASAD